MASRILIVEGTSGVGKSTLTDALIRSWVAEQPPRKLRTLLHLTQAHTLGPLAAGEDAGTLTVAENLAHLERVVSLLEWQVAAVAAETEPRFLAVVDTLHLTQCFRPGVVSFSDVAPFDQRLAALGARLLFVHTTPETLWERGILPRTGAPFVTRYAARKFGPSPESIHRHFVEEGANMRKTLAQTRITHRLLAIDGPLSAYLETARDHWLS